MNGISTANTIQNQIHTIRDTQVMLDRDLAKLYGVETRVLNQTIQRNTKRFPAEFMFQLNKTELKNWKSQNVISNRELMGLRKKPYAFTEPGVIMLASVLKSNTAVQISIKIIKAFIEMRQFLSTNARIFQRLDYLEHKQLLVDKKFNKLFLALEKNSLKPKQGIFYNGQIFDAHLFISDLIKGAKKDIILIDNFIDETVLELFSKKRTEVKIIIYTKNITKITKFDLKKFREQYGGIEIKEFKKAHDRFLIIDSKNLYHIGASLKDLGKKWFAFSKMDNLAKDILTKLK
ncbi:MAG: ORF6N domain-containing protein [Candidatus Pacebacteria bacterium]|jgi:phage regulator Rha-like protein|nr:ORF6N domain-containing protein [Candidatus Paceibacterota bacterium]MBT4004463.1 ORF6N domain-containing protein [Candidatus Paceibacterota bacterium]MBT4358575.1 ORF6N domain-containing protein [Candidatus Paceibacterota bacterium]MBT4680515.1 ORF6N domain-containing protein [Candidatus Paceibacterota bacterium]MBT6898744.1 ORF6N domain-containing protein [Candidatus Paceibacterota bacterium]